MSWFCVRAVFVFEDGLGDQRAATYEERLTLWQAADLDAAMALAEGDAVDYARCLDGCVFSGLMQAYELPEEPGHGAEVFSLMRDSALPAEKYLNTFFDTGRERQGVTDPGLPWIARRGGP
ncbi:hypothetical protein [Actinoplanes sp. L3-i22]|uniref:hypothetical protein n=1 Tax=Actinoplanes sp. L3-i22 TaxID=2836373 RepID=UPI001C864ABA|nr:hypothetical protein [Actinoplanes sp. L3-i22]